MKKLFLYIIVFMTIYLAFYLLGRYVIYDALYKKDNNSVNTVENETSVNAVNSNEKSEDKYIVTILDDNIVVYKNNLNDLYENTEIDVEVLKLTNNDIYKKLQHTIIFNDKEKLYRFLEGLSS